MKKILTLGILALCLVQFSCKEFLVTTDPTG